MKFQLILSAKQQKASIVVNRPTVLKTMNACILCCGVIKNINLKEKHKK